MSYALELTEPAINDLRQLETWLQEDALDEIELMLVNPPKTHCLNFAVSCWTFPRTSLCSYPLASRSERAWAFGEKRTDLRRR